MRLATGLFIGLSLLVAFVALFYIHRLEKYLESPSWNRKRLAWVFMAVCMLVGIYDIGTTEREIHQFDLLFTLLLFVSLAGYTDSYRLLLKSVRHLPLWKK